MSHFPSSILNPSSAATAALASSVTLFFLLRPVASLVHLRGSSFSFTFIAAPARFTVPVDGSGVCGSLLLADPLDACSPLRTNFSSGYVGPTTGDRFVLIERGQCSFDRKFRVAQDAGFQSAIVFDDQETSYLYSMIGNPTGIQIHAVFVSKIAGETLKKYANGEGECCICPTIEDNAGTVLVISFVSVVVIISVIATFLFARNCWILQNARRSRPSSMDKQEVEILPCFTFKSAYLNRKCITETCAICLEDYQDGEKLRVLPCLHDFHSACVDSWLTKWGTSCPICKHEMNSRGNAFGPSFGTVCFSGTVLGAVRVVRVIVDTARREEYAAGFVNLLLRCCANFLLAAFDFVNKFTINFAAITGESYCSAAKMTYELLSRNLLSAAFVETVSTRTLIGIIFVISTIYAVAACAILKAINDLGTKTYFIAVMAWLLLMVLLVYFIHVLENVIDTVYICFAIDRDKGEVSKQEVHEVFVLLPVSRNHRPSLDSRPLQV